jgi:prepilin-type N-terminal cleavage/methylation domain-containing protein
MKILKSNGFTLLELLLAMALGSFVMLGMMQSYRSVLRYIERTHSMMEINRQVCLLFNQIERDFETAFIFYPHKESTTKAAQELDTTKVGEIKPEKKKALKDQTKEEKEKAKQEEEKLLKTFFVAKKDEDSTPLKVDTKKISALKKITFICSNPFQVYGQRKPRLVRVGYELIKNKEASKDDKIVYDLWRRETADLLNTDMKDEEEITDKKKPVMQKHLVAIHVKGFWLAYATQKSKKKSDIKQPPEESQEITFSSWGDTKENSGVVPQKIYAWIEFWDEQKITSISFHALFPVASYPTPKEKPKKMKKVKKKKKKVAGEADKAGEEDEEDDEDGDTPDQTAAPGTSPDTTSVTSPDTPPIGTQTPPTGP